MQQDTYLGELQFALRKAVKTAGRKIGGVGVSFMASGLSHMSTDDFFGVKPERNLGQDSYGEYNFSSGMYVYYVKENGAVRTAKLAIERNTDNDFRIRCSNDPHRIFVFERHIARPGQWIVVDDSVKTIRALRVKSFKSAAKMFTEVCAALKRPSATKDTAEPVLGL